MWLCTGLTQVQSQGGVVVFHSGVARGANGSLVTWGGRVLLVCARAASLRAAAAAATAAVALVDFPGAHYRKDIAHRAFTKYVSLTFVLLRILLTYNHTCATCNVRNTSVHIFGLFSKT